MNKYCSKGACLVASLFFLFIMSCTQKTEQEQFDAINTDIKEYYTQKLLLGAEQLQQLEDAKSLTEQQNAYKQARQTFKELELYLAKDDVENFQRLNAPNILKVEEEDATDIKITEPTSLQVIEENLFAENPSKEEIETALISAKFVKNRFKLLAANNLFKHQKHHHYLWALKDAVVRNGFNGLTGFDSPMLSQSLQETAVIYNEMALYVKRAKPLFTNKQLYKNVIEEFEASSKLLNEGDFDTFDRYSFIKNHTHKQLELLKAVAEDWEVEFPFELAINNNATSLFDKNTFNIGNFADARIKHLEPNTIALGKKLFNDKNLSKARTMSCATCHKAELAFTDGLKISKNQKRNSPTLTYAGLQHGMFADKRAGSLEGQIVSVVNSETEFHTDLETLIKAVNDDSSYKKDFDNVFKGQVTDANIRFAIAEYIRSLAPFDSKFDRNINGQENTLTKSEIRGFNIFMGKGSCATCHFAPVFNGTIPATYAETEMELLGVPSEPVWENATVDADLGAYNLYNTEERKYFFKTPTIRNIALTAPYMHNGVYETLEEVIKFYNVGGGAGIGIDLEYQTLPPDPLELTDDEVNDLVAFMKTLTDNRFEN